MKQNLYTLAEAAQRIGCDKATTSRQAAALSVGTRIGRYILVTEAEVKKLAKVIKPRPRKEKGT